MRTVECDKCGKRIRYSTGFLHCKVCNDYDICTDCTTSKPINELEKSGKDKKVKEEK